MTTKGNTTRPDGLISQKELSVLLGVGKSALHRWRIGGIVTPAKIEGAYHLYKIPTPEEIAAINERRHEIRVSASQRGAAIAAQSGISATSAQMARERHAALRLEDQPEGTLTFAQVAEHLGVWKNTVGKWVNRGHLPCIEGKYGRYIPKDAIEGFTKPGERITARRAMEGAAKPRAPKKSVYTTKKPLVFPTLSPATPSVEPVVRPVVVAAGSSPYEEAIRSGRANPCFGSALGFNLLTHRTLGFRAAPVNEKVEGGWRYHERHAKNGFGNWSVRSQRPLTGEIVL